jgi:hypothetical protein
MQEQALTELLAAHATVKLATSDGRGNPWLAAAYFATDGPFVLRLMLEDGGRTLANMRANPNVAVMIENGDAFVLFGQAAGRASLASGEEETYRAAIAVKTPVSAPLVAIPALLAVRIDIERWRLTDVPAGWLPAKEVVRPDAA